MATFSLRVCMLRDFALLVAGDCVAARFMECGAREATSEAGTRARALGRRLLHVRYTRMSSCLFMWTHVLAATVVECGYDTLRHQGAS